MGVILFKFELRAGLAAATIAMVLAAAAFSTRAPAAVEERALTLYSINTKERLEVIFKRDGQYIPAAMTMINHFMRDWRRDEPTKMDPALIDLIWELHTELGSKEPIHLISGYRSKKTNNMLRRTRGGQGRKSQHILGKAADIHFPDISIKQLRNSALIRQIGGVGYYPTSAIQFVHVDTGRVRHWPRLPRQELAMLFPSGKTKHRPKSGKPITKRDHEVAMAKFAPKRSPIRQQKLRASQPVLASVTPEALPNLPTSRDQGPATDSGQVASTTAPAAEANLQLASMTGSTDALGKLVVRMTQGTALTEARSNEPAMDDADHPDLLSYDPVSTLPIVTASDNGNSQRRTQLIHPDQDQAGYRLLESEPRMAMSFSSGSNSQRLTLAPHFEGHAVKQIYAAKPKGRLAQARQQRPFQVARR
jgi:uncharacterized protein YcbK (DUF882 family)